MIIIENQIALAEIRRLAAGLFGNMIKAVVDLGRRRLAVDAELHSDLEALLLTDGARQADLWGINLYPDLPDDDFIEFDSVINLRPSQNNLSRGVEREDLRRQIRDVVHQRIAR